jgi:phosphoribosylamine--glycine ligase
MNVLVIGSGAREHALLWKLRQSPKAPKLFCAPGNAGTAEIATNVALKATDLPGLCVFAQEHRIDLTVVGPEQPLIDGIVDLFEHKGLDVFGPSQKAAAIEGSKVFAKAFMQKYNIPTASFRHFGLSQYDDAVRHIRQSELPIVLKADGIAAGKGVSVCERREDALRILEEMMHGKVFGEAGTKVVIEEYLSGEEVSILALTDGKNFVTLAPSQDHKQIFDGDMGKNTGGMGAYAPVPFLSPEMIARIETEIVKPTLDGLAKEGCPYKGCLYAGLMMTMRGPKVIEFNCRFGDPETEVVLPLLDEDLLELMLDISRGSLNRASVKQKSGNAVCVVIASGGYPDAYQTGKKILGIEEAKIDPETMLFHAGTKRENGALVTAGGRVLAVTTQSNGSLGDTIDKSYHAVRKIAFDGAYYRRDIGKKAMKGTTV